MPFHASVLYPNENDTKFDLNYYLKTHMPALQAGFPAFGLKRWHVTQYESGPDGAQSPYVVQTLLVFDNADQFGKALASETGQALAADIVNFTNKNPIIISGAVVGCQ